MWRIVLLVFPFLTVVAHPAVGQDRKDTTRRSVQENSAFLVGRKGWRAEGVPVTTFDGKKAKAKLSLDFVAATGKAAGEVTLAADGTSVDADFDLLEKDGKQFLKVNVTDGLLKQDFTLEYSIGVDVVILKGGMTRWVTHEADFTRGVLFKAVK